MKWTAEGIQTAQREKGYVDTAVVPIIQISWGDTAMGYAVGSEYTMKFCEVMENMYKGRLIVFPHLSYIDTTESNFLHPITRLEEQLHEGGIRHIIYVASSLHMKTLEDKISGSMIWLAPVPLSTLNAQQQQEILLAQVKTVMQNIEAKWRAVDVSE